MYLSIQKKNSQSLARLSRNNSYRHDTNGPNNNVLLLRADVTDFWKFCLASSSWHTHAVIIQHYLLYPNPYPKKSRLMNRFYAHPAFPLLMMTLTMNSMNSDGDDDVVDIDTIDRDDAKLVVRSNWKGYLDEFCVASEVWIKSGADFDDWNSFLSNNNDDDSCCEGWNPSSKPGQWEILGPKQLLNGVMESSSPPMTNFEAKFLQCGEPVYELSIRRKRSFQYTLNN
jgi:hypothetical protein